MHRLTLPRTTVGPFRFWIRRSFALALLILFTACVPEQSIDPTVGFATPEEFLLNLYSRPPYSNPSIKSKLQWHHGMIYLYTFEMDADGQPRDMLGYKVFTRNKQGTAWINSTGEARQLAEPASPLAQVYVGNLSPKEDEEPILYGQTLDPQVKKIQVIYDHGSEIGWVHEDVYLILAPGSAKICSLWLLDENDQILDRVNISEHFSNLHGVAKAEECSQAE